MVWGDEDCRCHDDDFILIDVCLSGRELSILDFLPKMAVQMLLCGKNRIGRLLGV